MEKIALANRNNNPGNLRDTTTGKFREFSSPQEGYAALLNDLEIKKSGQSKTGLQPTHTLVDFAKVYAPASDKNNPAQYAANIANIMGVRPDTQLKDLDTGKWAEAVAQSEGYKNKEVNVKKVQTEQQRANFEAQGKPVSVNPEKAEPTFMGNVARGIIKPFAEVGTNIVNAGQIALGQPETKPFSGKYLGDVEGLGKLDITKGLTPENVKTLKKSVGAGLEIGSTIAGGGGVKAVGTNTLKGLIKQGAVQGLKTGTVAGLSQGAGTALSQDKPMGQVALQGLLGGITGGAGGAVLGGLGGGLGSALEKAGVNKIAQNRTAMANPQEIIDMVNPKMTTKQVQAAIKSGQAVKKGVMGDIILKPSPKVIRSAEAVTGIVDPSKTLVENVNLVRNAIADEATALKNEIIKVDHPYVFKELQSKLRLIPKPISIKSDATLSKQFDLVRKAAMDIAKKNGGMVSSLMDSRKEFDDLIAREFPNLYLRENAPMKNAILAIREGMNSFIESQLPKNNIFRASLAKQTAMFNAIDGMATKASAEIGTSAFGRSIQKHPIATGLIKKGLETTAAGGILKGIGL